MTLEIIVVILIFPVILIGNVLIFYFNIKRAIKQFVIPFLAEKGYELIEYKWVGFWGCGDFKNEQMDFALFKTGLNSISIYSYIYYKNLDGTKRATIKIDVESAFAIVGVTYSNEME